jgi:hypothetical protein
MKLAYSYIRFSSGEQKKSDSFRRQWEDCVTFCDSNDLFLEKSRQFYDEAISAFRGKNRTEGALGVLLEMIKSGGVPVGSVIVIEAFDRLSREDVFTAYTTFTDILKSGMEIVTLVDKQWYSREAVNKNMGQLFISLGAIWSAHNYSVQLADRVGKAWTKKQNLAFEKKKPMTKMCPYWLKQSADGTHFEIIPERAKIVRLIFWLTLRGWGRGRIATLFNKHRERNKNRERAPVWGTRHDKAEAWNFSYIQKIQFNRAVIGEFTPHTARGKKRRPAGAVIKGYYPPVIKESVFMRVHNRGYQPTGPQRDLAVNIFQGLLFDGDFQKYSMWFRDHGKSERNGEWAYVVSDQHRVQPKSVIFTWRYVHLEKLVLNYLADMDWSKLTSERSSEVSKLNRTLEEQIALIADISKQITKLLEIGKAAGDIDEITSQIKDLNARREESKKAAEILRQEILAKSDFNSDKAAAVIRQFADAKDDSQKRKLLRGTIRSQVARIELFRAMPEQLKSTLVGDLKDRLQRQFNNDPRQAKNGKRRRDILKMRCVRIKFHNGKERWIIEPDDKTNLPIRIDEGMQDLPNNRTTIEYDELGVTFVDKKTSREVTGEAIKADMFKEQKEARLKAKVESWEKSLKKRPPTVLTREILKKAVSQRKMNPTK